MIDANCVAADMTWLMLTLVRLPDGTCAVINFIDVPERCLGDMPSVSPDGFARFGNKNGEGKEDDDLPAPTPAEVAQALERYAASSRRGV